MAQVDKCNRLNCTSNWGSRCQLTFIDIIEGMCSCYTKAKGANFNGKVEIEEVELVYPPGTGE